MIKPRSFARLRFDLSDRARCHWRYVDRLSNYDIPFLRDRRCARRLARAGQSRVVAHGEQRAHDDHVEHDETSNSLGARFGRNFFGRFAWHLV